MAELSTGCLSFCIKPPVGGLFRLAFWPFKIWNSYKTHRLDILRVFYILKGCLFRYSLSLQNIDIKMAMTPCQEDAVDNTKGYRSCILWGMAKMKKVILWLIKSFSDCVFFAVMVAGLYLIARLIPEHAALPCLVWIIAVSCAYVKFYSRC